MMFGEELGQRIRRPVVREGFLEEEEFVRILMDQYGVTEKELEDDVAPSGTSGVYKVDKAVICIPEKGRVTLCADETSSNDVLQYLQTLSAEDVFGLWEIKENRKAIGGLIRNPGGWHEWLMVAALPYLRAMGIPLTWIREFRTKTTECNFYYQEDDGKCYEGSHGGSGSTKMHNDLFQCYAMAYQSFLNEECTFGKEAINLIGENLFQFAGRHYDKNLTIADELKQLIERLQS